MDRKNWCIGIILSFLLFGIIRFCYLKSLDHRAQVASLAFLGRLLAGEVFVKHIINSLLESRGFFHFHVLGFDRFAKDHAYARWVEVGALKRHARGFFAHLAVGASHDTRDRDGSCCIGDNDIFPAQKLALLIVERGDLFAFAGLADDELCALELIEVEGVERLTTFEEHVIGHIDEVVDGSLADGLEAAARAQLAQAAAQIRAIQRLRKTMR